MKTADYHRQHVRVLNRTIGELREELVGLRSELRDARREIGRLYAERTVLLQGRPYEDPS